MLEENRIKINTEDAINLTASEILNSLKEREISPGTSLFFGVKRFIDKQGVLVFMTLNEDFERRMNVLALEGIVVESFDNKPLLTDIEDRTAEIADSKLSEYKESDSMEALLTNGIHYVMSYNNDESGIYIHIDFNEDLDYELSILEFNDFVMCKNSDKHLDIYYTPSELEAKNADDDEDVIFAVTMEGKVRQEDEDVEDQCTEDIEDEDEDTGFSYAKY